MTQPSDDLALAEWAREKGMVLNGVEARKIPGRGIGIVVTRDLEPGQTILSVPLTAFISRPSLKSHLQRNTLTPRISHHGLLAACLALDLQRTSHQKPLVPPQWRSVLPSREDFRVSMPFFWPDALQADLPLTARNILRKQEEKIDADWEAATRSGLIGEGFSRGKFEYAWFLVNTRSFYFFPTANAHSNRGAKGNRGGGNDRSGEEKMVMIPVADLLNHSPQGCTQSFSSLGLNIKTDRKYTPGEEVYVTYGRHANDFLLAEYGFILDENQWDEVSLDEVVLPLLSRELKSALEKVGFLGGYVLDEGTTGCFRTQVALRGVLGVNWRGYFEGAREDASVQGRVDELLARILGEYDAEIQGRIDKVERLGGLGEETAVVIRRWQQIAAMIRRARAKLVADNGS